MRERLYKNAKAVLSAQNGSITAVIGLIIVGVIGASVVIVDYTRVSTLQGKLQLAIDTSVTEAARGRSDAEVIGYAKGQIGNFLGAGNYANVDAANFTITRAGDRAEMSGSIPYTPLFGPLYGLKAGDDTLMVVASAVARDVPLCQPLPSERRWTSQSQTCPAGQIGSNSWEIEEERVSVCAPGATAPNWADWTPNGNRRNEVNSCAVACVAPTAQTQWSDRSAACAAGHLGTNTWQAEQRRTASCPSPTGSPVWTGWTDTGTIRNQSNTCAVACTIPSTATQWVNRSAACGAGHVGSNTWQAEQRRTAYCPAATGSHAWNGWVDTGNIRNQSNTCAVACTVPSPATQWVNRSAACAAGHVGSNTWQAEQRRTAYCPAATGSHAWNGWADTGNIRNQSNTCVPTMWAPRSGSHCVRQGSAELSKPCPRAGGTTLWAFYKSAEIMGNINTAMPSCPVLGDYCVETSILRWDSSPSSLCVRAMGVGTWALTNSFTCVRRP